MPLECRYHIKSPYNQPHFCLSLAQQSPRLLNLRSRIVVVGSGCHLLYSLKRVLLVRNAEEF